MLLFYPGRISMNYSSPVAMTHAVVTPQNGREMSSLSRKPIGPRLASFTCSPYKFCMKVYKQSRDFPDLMLSGDCTVGF